MSATVQLLEGADARAQLANATFRTQWQALHAACPWATVYQGMSFTDAWWDIYHEVFVPLVLTSHHDNTLDGLLLLARDRATGQVAHVGTFHAEYHGGLALEHRSDSFMRAALARLAQHGVSRLRLHFLTPNAPVAWVAHHRAPVAPFCRLAPHDWGVRELQGGALDTHALRKRGTRSKLARVQRDGPVALQVVEGREAFARWLPQIIAQSNARHGAPDQPGPFAADPRKADFYLRLMDTPGLMHCAVLAQGDRLLASHTGPIDGRTVGLGLLTHDASAAEHSPGTLLLHLLGERLGQDGFETFDLTPGGAYKERFATHRHTAFTLDMHLSASAAAVGFAEDAARRLVRTLRAARARG